MAWEGVNELKAKVDTHAMIPNERLLESVDKNTTLSQAFATADEVAASGLPRELDLIPSGMINCDLRRRPHGHEGDGAKLHGAGCGEGRMNGRSIRSAGDLFAVARKSVSISRRQGRAYQFTGARP